METRSRKRVEATAHRPSPASKRARHSGSGASSSSSATAAAGAAVSSNPPPPRARPSTRTSTAAAAAASVSSSAIPTAQSGESGMDTVPSSSSRRDQETSGRGESERACKRPMEEDEEDQRAIEVKEIEKGKEKEAEKEREAEKEKEKERIRGDVCDRDRTDAAAAAAAATAACSTDDDENDGEGDGGSSLHQNRASASSALHGLLRKLGAGLDDLLPPSSVAPSSHQSSRLKRILSGLRAEGEEGRQLEALSQLCELLSIGTEDSLSSFSVDSFVPLLVGLLNHEYSPDMMLLAARALTHLCDVLPSSCAAVVHYGAVPCFCARLLTIEYIDLAEQVSHGVD
jgi:E3 ubiquitin-protein ligase TRIP12